MNPSASRIAARIMNLQDAQAQLNALNELSENISAITDTFELHFRTAAEIDPTVKTQFEALIKSKKGLEKATAVRQGVQELIKLYPEDKTALRALADAETMVKRYVAHVNDSRKMIQTISKKQMPAALKKMSKIVAEGIQARLTDPSKLEVIPWQDQFGYTNLTTRQNGACFQVVFRVALKNENGYEHNAEIILKESTVLPTGPFFQNYAGDYNTKPTTAKAVIDAFLEKLQGYPGLKGESDKILARVSVAKSVASIIDTVCSRLHDGGVGETEISADNRFISGSYRSDLPKEGALGMDQWKYDQLVMNITQTVNATLNRQLALFKNFVKKTDVHTGEKGWVYIKVELI